MGRSKDLWIAECERVAEAFGDGDIGEEEFRTRMSALGFERDAIDEEIAAVREIEAA